MSTFKTRFFYTQEQKLIFYMHWKTQFFISYLNPKFKGGFKDYGWTNKNQIWYSKYVKYVLKGKKSKGNIPESSLL